MENKDAVNMLDHAVESFTRYDCLAKAVEFLSFCSAATDMTSAKGKASLLDSKLKVASKEPTLFLCMSKFRSSLNVGPASEKIESALLKASSSEFSNQTLLLIREIPTTIISLVFTKKEDKHEKSLDLFNLVDFQDIVDVPIQKRRIKYKINVVLTDPLVHGDENKQGNAILFRKRRVSGGMELPFYSANSVGHHLRVLLAEDFLRRVGLHPSTTDRRYMVWFNEFLHNGGKLGAAPKEFCKRIGGTAAGAIKSDGMKELRNMMPFISILGGNAKGSFEGRIMIKNLLPVCREYGTGDRRAHDLLSWEFGTTSDPFADSASSKAEAKKNDDEEANTSMIYSLQTLAAGTELEGGFNLSDHATDIEESCFGHGIDLLIKHGHLGGKSNKGYGGCNISCDNIPDSQLYLDYLEGNQEEIRDYINSIGAFK